MKKLTSRLPAIVSILTEDPSSDFYTAAALRLKQLHTACVARNCALLATASACTEREVDLAERLGWCHDLGRFPQFRRYQTFDDSKSADHALLSLKLIRALRLDRDLLPAERGILWASVMLHNRATLPPQLPPDVLFFTALLRDADRLNIFRIFKDYYNQGPAAGSPLELGYPDTGEISPEVAGAILSGISPRYELGHSVQDMRLIKLSWAYSLKTPGALALFHSCGIIEATRAVLPDTPTVRTVLHTISLYKDR